jgi:methylated-DNA-[protein]-cysteine S-methyltransferase
MIAATALIETPHGIFKASFSSRGLMQLQFPGTFALNAAAASPPTSPSPQLKTWIRQTANSLGKALRGFAPENSPPFDFPSGTSFQKQVWEVLLSIPLGCVMTYGEIASRLRRPYAARAVGQACGANLIPVLIPCHRVLAARGGLGGFSGGLNWKLKLLKAEGQWPLAKSAINQPPLIPRAPEDRSRSGRQSIAASGRNAAD